MIAFKSFELIFLPFNHTASLGKIILFECCKVFFGEWWEHFFNFFYKCRNRIP